MGNIVLYHCENCGWKSEGKNYRALCPKCSEMDLKNTIKDDDSCGELKEGGYTNEQLIDKTDEKDIA